jgi:hypothetical protein
MVRATGPEMVAATQWAAPPGSGGWLLQKVTQTVFIQCVTMNILGKINRKQHKQPHNLFARNQLQRIFGLKITKNNHK